MDERSLLRKEQSKKVMPMIGPLLTAWYDLPNDVKSDPELTCFSNHIDKIDSVMEGSE